MTHTNFQIFLKISAVVMVEIVDLALRTVIDSFEMHTMNSLVKQKIQGSFHYVQSFIWRSTAETKQILLLLLTLSLALTQ